MPSARGACQEVRSTTTVEYIGPAVHRDCIVAAAGVDEPIVIADTDIQVVAGYADILVLQTADGAGVGVRQARGRRSYSGVVGDEACAGNRIVVADIVGCGFVVGIGGSWGGGRLFFLPGFVVRSAGECILRASAEYYADEREPLEVTGIRLWIEFRSDV